jgi:uncharacterized HAD superfamily protein
MENQWRIEGDYLNRSTIKAFDYSGRAVDVKFEEILNEAITISLPTSLAFIHINGQYNRLPVGK